MVVPTRPIFLPSTVIGAERGLTFFSAPSGRPPPGCLAAATAVATLTIVGLAAAAARVCVCCLGQPGRGGPRIARIGPWNFRPDIILYTYTYIAFLVQFSLLLWLKQQRNGIFTENIIHTSDNCLIVNSN